MAVIMVYAMIIYNIAIEFGAMSNQIFILALHELIIMGPIALVLEGLFVEQLALKLAFKIIKETDGKIVIIWVIQIMIVLIMCSLMSLVATLLFTNSGNQIISIWLQKYVINMPFALGYQLIICGPLVRTIMKYIPIN